MKINKKKLGFTLVELLVVIAILAVLATVAIIGYSSFINEAHKSNDNSVVTELNHYLKAANPLDEKVPTATDAAEKLDGCGLNIAQLQPSTKDAYYGYNYETKEFVFVEGPLQVSEANIKTFLFAKNQTQVDAIYTAHYSVYLQEGYESTDFNAVYGLDVGKATVTNVTYTNTTLDDKTDGIEVVIRTNSANTNLTIDDSSTGTIYHYGSAGELNVIQCHTGSYHENGNVAFAEIAKGRIVLEGGSEIKHIHVNKKTNEEAFDTVIIADNGAKVLPEAITRDEVTVTTETLVVKVESNGTTENVYVYADGTTGNKGSTEKITTGENKQNENVNSNLGKLVLDNGSASDKALGDSAKESTRDEIVEMAVIQEEIRHSNHEHTFVYTSNNNGTHTGICECGETVTEDCDYTAWSHDAEGHWHSCSKCGDGQSEGKVAHTWSLGADDTNSSNHCTTCGRFRWTAAIGNVGYETLKAAIAVDKTASSESGYKGTLITMLNDEFITDTQYVTIYESQIVTLNLNGCVLLQEIGHSDSQTHIISSKGTLTINDNSVSKTGMIYSHHKNTSAKWQAGHYAVDCAKGSITINGGTLKQVNDVTDISWALHCGSYGVDATTTINGGTFIGDYYDVGLYNNSGGSQKAYINGGTFKGTGTNIYMQFATSNSNPGMLLEINGGEFITSKRNIVYVSGQPGTVGVNASDLKLSVTGGSFSVGDDYKNNGLVIGFASYSVSGEDDSYVSGGTFNFNPESECMNGYYVKNENGSYKVKSVTEAKNEDFIVQVGNTLHCMFKSAVKDADEESTIRILKDCEISSSIDKNIVIDLNGRTINGSFSISASDVTIKNGTISGAGTAITIYSTSQIKAKVTLDNVNIVSTESDAIVMKGNAIINFNNNCSVITSGSGCDAIYVTSEENEIIGSGNVTLSGVNADLHLHAYDNYRNNGSGVYVVTNYNGTLNIDITGTMTFVNNKLSVTESSKYYNYFDVGGSWNSYAHQLPSSKVTAELSISNTGTFNIDVAEYVINN